MKPIIVTLISLSTAIGQVLPTDSMNLYRDHPLFSKSDLGIICEHYKGYPAFADKVRKWAETHNKKQLMLNRYFGPDFSGNPEVNAVVRRGGVLGKHKWLIQEVKNDDVDLSWNKTYPYEFNDFIKEILNHDPEIYARIKYGRMSREERFPKYVDKIHLTWEPSIDPESGVKEYVVYCNGQEIGRTEDSEYYHTLHQFFKYKISAVNGVGMESAHSEAREVQLKYMEPKE